LIGHIATDAALRIVQSAAGSPSAASVEHLALIVHERWVLVEDQQWVEAVCKRGRVVRVDAPRRRSPRWSRNRWQALDESVVLISKGVNRHIETAARWPACTRPRRMARRALNVAWTASSSMAGPTIVNLMSCRRLVATSSTLPNF